MNKNTSATTFNSNFAGNYNLPFLALLGYTEILTAESIAQGKANEITFKCGKIFDSPNFHSKVVNLNQAFTLHFFDFFT